MCGVGNPEEFGDLQDKAKFKTHALRAEQRRLMRS